MCLRFILLNVVGAKELLEVKVSDLCVAGLKKIPKLIVHNKNATVFGVLETLFGDVLVDRLGDFTPGDEFSLLETKERTKFVSHLLLTVESVVFGTLLSLFTVGILLFRLDFTNNLSEGLQFGTNGSKVNSNGFKRHYI